MFLWLLVRISGLVGVVMAATIDPFTRVNTCVGYCRANGPAIYTSQTGVTTGGGGVTLTLQSSATTDYSFEITPPEVADAVELSVVNSELVLNAAKDVSEVVIGIKVFMPSTARLERLVVRLDLYYTLCHIYHTIVRSSTHAYAIR